MKHFYGCNDMTRVLLESSAGKKWLRIQHVSALSPKKIE
ncbi:hypothetical protein GPUN_2222 [Glaciecola punicea ACAM 611]|uniref:Uncharacterized protein n=1 Tax=Glaciecola punicea ACAM 611 TaxID=1121923 RepID=H5TDG0_9ALTE|nr:hypothetical protein GPUN_2222 [Glaciecola punicea ACAM 611]